MSRNGADVLCSTLLENDLNVCFANPGTSEMHFVAALDRQKDMRCVLGLFEGVVTGAADGYARMADKPAATLLHLGPGLGNGLANLHNAKRAGTPIVNIVGDHATYHLQYDAPLTSDIEGLARPMSDWVHTTAMVDTIAADAARAVRYASGPPGKVATLILPANVAWAEAPETAPAPARIPVARPQVDASRIVAAAAMISSGEPTLILMGGSALRGRALELLGRIATKTGVALMSATSNPRAERGLGRTPLQKLPYAVDLACQALASYRNIVLICAKAPVAFFAYPGKPSLLAPQTSECLEAVSDDYDVMDALALLAELLNVRPGGAGLADAPAPVLPTTNGKLTGNAISAVVAALLPANAIVCDESISQGRDFSALSTGSAPYDYLQLTGGAIGIGMPLAVGAAVACPDRKVITLEGDGSGMYTLQALWTQARESLNCLTVVFSNRTYAILLGEMKNVGVTALGHNATQMLRIDNPAIDWVSLAKGMGVPAARVDTIDDFITVFKQGLAMSGPMLIEALI
jgi:acetolactate synthase-1/2/3 large subunit